MFQPRFMVLLNKLKIKGIRSYSPNETNVISFDSPLTMILGPNGSGKTTIIEALKYITTGELPMNTRGGAFINDPKIYQKCINTASVSLEFQNGNDETIQIKRTIQATVKNNALTQKTLETKLSALKNDKWETLITKSLDIEAGLLSHFGVSPSLLQNVIFCHQEEANWILSEPINVKKKLDDIFATTKYSKALDGLKKLKKEIVQTLKIRNTELVAATEKKMKKERLVSDIDTTKNSIRDIEKKLKEKPEIDSQIQEVVQLIQKEKEKEKEYLSIQYEIQAIKTKLSENNNKLLSYDEIKELVMGLDEYSREILRNDENMIKNELSFLDMEASSHKTFIYKNIEELNQYIIEKDLHNLEKILFEKNMKFKKSHQETVQAIKKITDISLQIPHIYSNMDTLVAGMIKNENEIDCIEKSIINFVGQDVLNYEKHLIDLEQSDCFYDLKTEITNLQGKIKDYESGKNENRIYLHGIKTNLKNEIKKIDELSKENTKIKVELDEMKSLNLINQSVGEEDKILNKKLKCIEDLRLLENELEESRKKNDFFRDNKNMFMTKNEYECEIKKKLFIYEEFINDLDLFQDSNEIHFMDLNRYKVFLFSIIDENLFVELKKKLEDLAEDRFNIIKLINECYLNLNEVNKTRKITNLSDLFQEDDKDFIAALDQKIGETDKLLSLSESAKLLFLNFDKKGSSRNICYLCERGLNPNELINYKNHICKTINELDIKITRLTILKEGYEKDLCVQNNSKILNNVTVQNINSIKENLLELSVRISHTELQTILTRNEFKNTFEDLELNKLIKGIENRIKYQNLDKLIGRLDEISFIIKSKNELVLKWKDITVDESMMESIDVTDINEKVKLMKAEIEICDNFLFEIQRERATHEKLKNKQNLEHKLHKNELDLMDINKMIEEDQNQVIILENKDKEFDKSIKEILLQYQSKSNDYNKIVEERKDKIMKLSYSIKSLRENEAKREQKKKEFIDIYYKYENILGDSFSFFQFDDKLFNECKTLRQIIQDIHKKIIRLCFENISELNKIRELDEFNSIKIEENIKKSVLLKNYISTIVDRNRLNILQENISNFNFDNLKDLEAKLNIYSIERDSIFKIKYQLEGELKQLHQNIKNYTYTLANDYENIDSLYNKLYVEIKTTEILINDLEKSIKTLDGSIVEYYKSKIEDINIILKDLWISTYKGNDIEYVELKNEVSDNKTYNYKLVMIKNGVELDMRGRCSAGQKVLTGILVRLALCDAFCASCFIIGLDEPTTNLDRENIESLAYTIKRVVEERNRNSNFQLVIITHDETFAEMISEKGCDSFYKVSKDSNGNSQIKLSVKNEFK